MLFGGEDTRSSVSVISLVYHAARFSQTHMVHDLASGMHAMFELCDCDVCSL